MKVISLLQPWATLVVIGAKQIETRSWNTKYRGEILIHASAGKNKRYRDIMSDFKQEFFALQLPDYGSLPFGAVIGKVNLVETAPSNHFVSLFGDNPKTGLSAKLDSEKELAFGDFSEGRYGWLLEDAVSFEEHQYPVKGSLGLWNFDPLICMQCGCTGEDACVHPDLGSCWWITEKLCSHCVEGVFKNKIQ